ncbi:MAG: hypothetical protein O6934_02545 [SAR324 cluster bacterium]|nr:hypothetical protein [SAR324 cluster bacterium]
MEGIDRNEKFVLTRDVIAAAPAGAPPGEARDGITVPAGWLRFEQGSLSIDQVLRNLETAVSLLQTIDGGLAEVGTLMSETITTLHSAWNNGDRGKAVPPEYGQVLAPRLEQLDDIVRNCRFHGRGLIDGQSGVVGVGSGVDFVRGGPRTASSPPQGYQVCIKELPSKAAIIGGVAVHEDWLRSEQELFLAEGERFLRYNPGKCTGVPEFLRRLQGAIYGAGMELEVGLTRQRRLIVRHNQYGSHFKFKGFSRQTPLLSKRPGRMEWSRKGKDIQGTLHGERGFGIGRMLVGFQDNPNTSELAVIWRGERFPEGQHPRCFVVQNGIQFQDAPEPEARQRRISLPSFYGAALGTWLDTRSRYSALADGRAETWQELSDTLQLLFGVSCEVDEWRDQVRERITEYQLLALEYLRREVPLQPAPLAEESASRQVQDMAKVMRQLLNSGGSAGK